MTELIFQVYHNLKFKFIFWRTNMADDKFLGVGRLDLCRNQFVRQHKTRQVNWYQLTST